jgi:HD-GYP domain-containing protein (c-di-GMP phosphodiesterase class II)
MDKKNKKKNTKQESLFKEEQVLFVKKSNLAKVKKDKKTKENKNLDKSFYIQVCNDDLLRFLIRGAFFGKKIAKALNIGLKSGMFNYSDDLLLVDGYYDFSDNEVLVKINLEEEEIKNTRLLNERILVFSGFLPISRVECIYFRSEDLLNRFISLPYEDIPIPYRVCKSNSSLFEKSIKFKKIENIKNKKNEEIDWQGAINVYNRLLGSIQLVGMSNYYTYQNLGMLKSISDEYFFLLSLINKDTKKYVESVETEENIFLKNIFNTVFNFKENTSNFNGFILENILKNIHKDNLKDFDYIEYLKSLLVERDKKAKQYKITKKDKELLKDFINDIECWKNQKIGYNFNTLTEKYLNICDDINKYWSFFILIIFIKDNNSRDMKSLFSFLANIKKGSFDKSFISRALFILGYYFGYSNFPNNIKMSFDIIEESKIFNENIPLKFVNLDNFDKFVLESCYSFSLKKRIIDLKCLNFGKNKKNDDLVVKQKKVYIKNKKNILDKEITDISIISYNNRSNSFNDLIVLE